MRSFLTSKALLPALIFTAACSASVGDGGTTSGNGGSGSGTSGNGGNGSGQGGGSSSTFGNGVGGSTGSGQPTCDATPDQDKDGDGFTITQGDCNDCDPNTNPGAVEVIVDPNMGTGGGTASGPADENCDGNVDELPAPCDAALALDSSDPNDAARAVGLCKFAAGPTDWGVTATKWVNVDGTTPTGGGNFDLGHGMLSAFGGSITPREGGKLLGLSSGTARQPTDAGYSAVSGFDKGYTSGQPQGFPKESPSCPNVTTGTPHDGTAVEITLRAPSNANGFSFDFDFYTYEWPGYVCSQYNDFFVAILSPIPMGQTDGNISFDQLGNPVSVNNAFVQVCGCANGPPCSAGGKMFDCLQGAGELNGTGFEGHAATSWLTTSAPVTPGETITIRWGTYDSGDGVLDSTTVIDNWKWIAEPGTTVGTDPIPG
jgi:hypothetical protein